MLLGHVQVAPGGHELRPRSSSGVRGSLELHNGGLRVLEDAWENILLEAFSFSRPSFGGRVVRLLGPPRPEQAKSPKHSDVLWVIAGCCYRYFGIPQTRDKVFPIE